MYKPLQKKNSSWTPRTVQKKSKSPSKLGHFSIQPKPNKKSSQSQEIGEYSRDSADRLTANVMRSLEAKGSQETETPTVQPQSESRISVADVVGQRMPNLTPHTLSPLQRKLTVGQPGDKYEQEADTVAAKVVEQINSPTSQQPVQGKVEPVVEPTVMRDGGVGGGAVDASVEQSIQQAKGGGQGLSEDVREPMEQAFGADFSGVRVHNNSNADQLNRSLNARAFTTGPDIFFKQGEYNPGNREGQALLAHELTHVVQQNGNAVQRKPIKSKSTNLALREVPSLPGNAQENSRLFRKDITQFQKENPTTQISNQQQQLYQDSASTKVQLSDRSHTIRRCGCTSDPAFAPPIGRKKTKLKGTYGKFEVEHGLDKKPTASAYGEYYIKIEMTPNSKTAGSEIAFLQTARGGTSVGNWSTKKNDPYIDKAIADRTTKKGWSVDRANPAKDKTPLYGMKKNKAGKVVSRGNANTGKYKGANPWMWDIPGVPDPYAIQFVATAIDKSTGTSFGAVFWGFEYDSSKSHYKEYKPSLISKGDEKLTGRNEAIDKWNKVVATPGSGIDQAPTITE